MCCSRPPRSGPSAHAAPSQVHSGTPWGGGPSGGHAGLRRGGRPRTPTSETAGQNARPPRAHPSVLPSLRRRPLAARFLWVLSMQLFPGGTPGFRLSYFGRKQKPEIKPWGRVCKSRPPPPISTHCLLDSCPQEGLTSGPPGHGAPGVPSPGKPSPRQWAAAPGTHQLSTWRHRPQRAPRSFAHSAARPSTHRYLRSTRLYQTQRAGHTASENQPGQNPFNGGSPGSKVPTNKRNIGAETNAQEDRRRGEGAWSGGQRRLP